jgi:hypothetical protein
MATRQDGGTAVSDASVNPPEEKQAKPESVSQAPYGSLLSDYMIVDGEVKLISRADLPDGRRDAPPRIVPNKRGDPPQAPTADLLTRMIPHSALSINQLSDEAADEKKWRAHEFFTIMRVSG